MKSTRESNKTPVNGAGDQKTKRNTTLTFSEPTGAFPLVVSADIDWNDLKSKRLDPFLARLQEHAVLGAARGLSALVSDTSKRREGCRLCDLGTDMAVRSAKVFLGLDLEAFCRDVVVAMVENNHFAKVAKVQHRALESGAEQLVQQLSVSLLCSGHTKHASLVTNAFIEECERVGMTQREIAASLSNAVIAAVDSHHGLAVACVQKNMVQHGHFDIVKELTIYIGEFAGRPDVVAIGTLDAMRIDGGQEMAARVAAAAMAQGSVESVAHAASIMYARSHLDLTDVDRDTVDSDQEDNVCGTIAMAAVEGINVHHQPLAVVQVSHHMWLLGHGHAVSRAVKYMVDIGQSYPAGLISLTAMTHGYLRVSVWLLYDMLRSGYIIAVVIVALHALFHALFSWMNPWKRGGVVIRRTGSEEKTSDCCLFRHRQSSDTVGHRIGLGGKVRQDRFVSGRFVLLESFCEFGMEYSTFCPREEDKNDAFITTHQEMTAADKLGESLHGGAGVGPRRGSIESTETNNNVLEGSVCISPTEQSSSALVDHGIEHWSHRNRAPAAERSKSMKVAALKESFEEMNGGMGFPYRQIKLPPLEKVVKGDESEGKGYHHAAKSVAVVSTLSDRVDPRRMSPDFEVFFGDSCRVDDPLHSSFGKKNNVISDLDMLNSEHANERGAKSATSRGSFDTLVSHGAYRGGKPRRHSMESSVSAFPVGGNGQQRTGYGTYPTIAESLAATLQESDEKESLSNLRRTPLKSIDRVGFTVSAEPSGPKRRFRTGPSAAAHASQLVDQHTHPQASHEDEKELKTSKGSSAVTIMDADLHDTFGAHDWVVAQKKERPRSLLVSKEPTLSPIQSPGQQEKLSPRLDGMKNYPLASAHLSSDYLQRRKQARLDAEEYDKSGRGYIAEAKRVLNEAMDFMSSPESISTFDSYSGAIEPLLRHLKSVAGENRKCRSALRTLSLLESNLPNRAIISGLEGRRILLKVVAQCTDIDVQESGIQLLWDLDEQGGANAAEIMTEVDLQSFCTVLTKTRNCEIASHVLHFMKIALDQPPELRIYVSEPIVLDLSHKLTAETCAHSHYLQDAAQYCLGETLGALLSDVSLSDYDVKQCLTKILSALLACGEGGQCQLLLNVLSSLAGRRRPRSILVDIQGAAKVISFTESTNDARLQARAFSLLKVLSSGYQKSAKHQGSWYFDLDDHLE